ncbi:MAG: (2Fe-2S)-binding protein [Sinobacteraceae bacterium]|nr:(2Fe-2S)-binding protein [Nevskiaceae bacterium]
MYVCICNAVTDKDIRKAVDRGASSLFELQNELPVASCCGRCGDAAEAVINECLGKAQQAAAVRLSTCLAPA